MLSLGYLWHGMMLGMDRQTYNFLRLHLFKAVALKSIYQRNHFYSLTTDFSQSYLNSGGDVCCASHSIIYKKVAWCKFAIIPLVLNMQNGILQCACNSPWKCRMMLQSFPWVHSFIYLCYIICIHINSKE